MRLGPVSGDPPTKELPLHRAFYEGRPQTQAVVHLHSTFATALSCLADSIPEDAIPPITPYMVMRVGRVPVLPYTAPGSPDVAPLVRAKAPDHAAVLLANHGPVVAGTSLDAAVFTAEELEETAKLVVLTRGLQVRPLDRGSDRGAQRHLLIEVEPMLRFSAGGAFMSGVPGSVRIAHRSRWASHSRDGWSSVTC